MIAIFPFAVRGTGQSAYLGEGIVDLLSTTLATPSLRTVDPHALLARVSREAWTAAYQFLADAMIEAAYGQTPARAL